MIAPTWISAITSVAAAMTPETGRTSRCSQSCLRRLPPDVWRRSAPVRRHPVRARWLTKWFPFCRFTNSRPCRAASVARSRPSRAFSARYPPRLFAGRGRHEKRNRRPGQRAEYERYDDRSAPHCRLSPSVPPTQNMLTRTFRYFFGSLRMSPMSPLSSLAAPFMFSYNCLSWSNCPAAPCPCSRSAVNLSMRAATS